MEKERAKLLDELLNQIDRAYDLMEEYDSMSRKYGEVILYQVEAHLIKYIGEHPGTTVSDIAQDLNKTSSAASQMVKKLQTKGLIEQIKNEKNMLPVSFGAMLMESMLAIIALIAVASFADGEAAAQGLTTQPQIFAGAIANFLSVIGLPHSLVFTLINLAVSAFALTSLDSVARVGRLSFQEFFLDSDTDEENMSPFVKVVTNKYFATIITLVLAYLLTKVGYAEIWPLFGSANQLLSVLALVACAVFLKKTKRQGWMLWVPMVFMMAVTFTALGMTIVKLSKAFVTTGLDLGNSLQLIFAVLLLILGVLVAIQGIKKLLEKPDNYYCL